MKTLEFNIANDTKLYIRGGYASVVVLILSFMLMIGAFWLWWWLGLIGLAMLVVVCLINSCVIVEAGNTAYRETLGYVSSSVLTNGFHLVLPFITKIVEKETKQTEFASVDSDINMPKGITVKVDYVIAYRLKVHNVYRFAKEWIAPEQAFASSMRTATRAIMPLYECDELVDDKNITKTAALREAVRKDLEAKFIDILEANYYDGMDEVFEKISLATMDIEFPDSYLAARQRIVDAEQSAIAAEAEKKARIIESEGISLATVEMAKGDAKSIKLKGDAENAVLEKKGHILKENPDITPNTAAQRPPQQLVICGGNGTGNGGITPMIDILRGLYPHSSESEETTTAPTTPAPTTPTPPTP